MQVALLYNDDDGLAHGAAEDRFAAQAVLGAVAAVQSALERAGHGVRPIAVHADPRRVLAEIDQARAEVAFNLAEAVDGDPRLEAALAWLLELGRIPYTGSPPEALALALDKPLSKARLLSAGVPVAEGATLIRGDERLPPRSCLPWIVKPACQDASHGISDKSVVFDEDAARAQARELIERYRQPALVEEFIDGREFNVSLIGDSAEPQVLPLGEIDFSNFPRGRPQLVTYEAKWVEDSPDYRGTPSIAARAIAPELRTRIEEIARAAYSAVGVRDYGRVDLRLHPTKGPLVLEVNPNPDISPDAGLARAAARHGLDFDALIVRIVEAARNRAARRDRA
jgi:D-alanine-D-alanine ligase